MSKTVKDSIAIRQKINRQIVEELSHLVEEQPTMRFGQIITRIFPQWRSEGLVSADDIYNVVFNEEPAIHLARLADGQE